jgi:2',3'-cyclic-nucleotide 2'-phosphodiesterase (5'-nucleotidase family)
MRPKTQHRLLLVVFLFAVVLLAAAPALASSAAQTSTTTVTIVGTNDFHGALENRLVSNRLAGGAEWLAGYVNVVRAENPNGTLWIDAGDQMQGTLVSNYFFGSSTIDVMNAMGVDAAVVGNHEFDWGQDVLQDRVDQAEFPYLAANIFYAKKNGNPNHGHGGRPHYAKPYTIFEVNGVKVGVIGIALPETPSVTNPINVSNLVFLDGADAVNDVLPEVEAEGATIIIVAAHIGGFFPNFGEGIMDFTCGLDPDKVDLVVSGHTHSRIDDVMCDIPVVQAFSSGTAFSRVDFTVDTATGEATSYVMNPFSSGGAPTTTYNTTSTFTATYHGTVVTPDPVVEALVDEYVAEIAEVKNTVIGYSNTAITRNSRFESSMGDWVTDIMRAYDPSIDFALTNSGGLRAELNAGEVTFGEVFEIMPFDNTLVLVELTGAEVIQVLREGTTGQHGLIQVSGLKFSFDYGTAAIGDSVLVGDVIDLNTGQPIDPNATYTIATNDFMANGGDHYATLGANPGTNTFVLIRDLMVDWVEANSPFTAPDPATEQRITATGTPN